MSNVPAGTAAAPDSLSFASSCLPLLPTTSEPDASCCPWNCDLCLLRGGQAICSSSAGCLCRSAQPSQWSPDFPEALAPIQPSYCSVPTFSEVLGHKQFLLTWSMSGCLSTAVTSSAGPLNTSFPGACVSTMTYAIVRHIFRMWGPTQWSNHSPSSWWGCSALLGFCQQMAQPQLQSSPTDSSQSPAVMGGRFQHSPPSALKWVSQISG